LGIEPSFESAHVANPRPSLLRRTLFSSTFLVTGIDSRVFPLTYENRVLCKYSHHRRDVRISSRSYAAYPDRVERIWRACGLGTVESVALSSPCRGVCGWHNRFFGILKNNRTLRHREHHHPGPLLHITHCSSTSGKGFVCEAIFISFVSYFC
jgi:hypothetical protein